MAGQSPASNFFLWLPVGINSNKPARDDNELHQKNAHAVPLASARQHPENQKENQVGHSSERTVEGQTNPPVARSRLFKPDSEWYFFREVNPALKTGHKHRQNRLFRVCVIWPQKHEKRFFTKVRSQRAHFFVHHRPQGIYADLTSKLQREQTTGPPPFCFPSVISSI